jgi:transposase
VAAGRGLGAVVAAGAGVARAGGAGRLVAGDRGRVVGRREKGGGAVGRSLRGRSGSRFHLIVDANGTPFAFRIGPGNENERRQLLPLLDELLERERRPEQLWADRGYDGKRLRRQVRLRGVEPVISYRRHRGDPEPAAATATVYRGGRRRPKTVDPHGRHRWPVERTNSWLRNWRRVATRWERRPDYWLAVIQTAAAMVVWQMLETSFR